MKHPLSTHYRLQLARLLAAEARFLEMVYSLQLAQPSLQSYLGGIESDAEQRIDCLRLFLQVDPARTAASGAPISELEVLMSGRCNTDRRSMALMACARSLHQLINGYRVARELAHRLEKRQHASRIDQLLARMSDSLPCSQMPEPSHRDPVAIAG